MKVLTHLERICVENNSRFSKDSYLSALVLNFGTQKSKQSGSDQSRRLLACWWCRVKTFLCRNLGGLFQSPVQVCTCFHRQMFNHVDDKMLSLGTQCKHVFNQNGHIDSVLRREFVVVSHQRLHGKLHRHHTEYKKEMQHPERGNWLIEHLVSTWLRQTQGSTATLKHRDENQFLLLTWLEQQLS